MRALDFYSGVGGWSLGLQMAGIDVVQSYERWATANSTNQKNNHHKTSQVDIRTLDLDGLPKKIDFVVGSPPCTQFSLSNRGGGGDHEDGLLDIIRFFEIVDRLNPKKWAMENVPTVAKIIAAETKRGGRLYKFRHLDIKAEILSLDRYGLPQRRRRCIAGNFDFELLKSYANCIPQKTLGDVIRAFASPSFVDPIYGIRISENDLIDHGYEEPLSAEEERINRTAKVAHTVYNSMQFPDPLERPVRTITATSTRVSRESVVIEDVSQPGRYRRLTIRESASAQGFPATFQFFGGSYGQKIRMVGNAVPPLFSFYVGQAILGIEAASLMCPRESISKFKPTNERPSETKLDRAGSKFPLTRRFRFSIPNLRLKSGVRFELANDVSGPEVAWSVRLYFGTSKDIKCLLLHKLLLDKITSRLPRKIASMASAELRSLKTRLSNFDVKKIQEAWRHQAGCESHHPFMLVDSIGDAGARLAQAFQPYSSEAEKLVSTAILTQFGSGKRKEKIVGLEKLSRYAPMILAGILTGATANLALTSTTQKRSPKRVSSKREELVLAA